MIKEGKNAKRAANRTEPVSLSRRFFAYLIDWYLGGLMTAFPIAVFSMKQFDTVQNQNIMEFAPPTGVIAGCLGVLFALIYYVVIPTWGWKGQTPGKRMLRLKIVQQDESEVSLGTVLLRQFVGIMIIEGGLVTASAIWHQVAELLTGISLVVPLMYAGLIVSFISAIFVAKDQHLAIHDRLANTKVIQLAAC